MRQYTISVVLVVLVACAGMAQETPAQQLQAANAQFTEQCKARQWDAALATLDRMDVLADRAGLNLRGNLLYVRASVHALAGHKAQALAVARAAVAAGHTDYWQFLRDSDFDSLRGDAEFKAFMADLKVKYGPQQLAWDDKPAPPFSLTFDDPNTSAYRDMREEFAIDQVVAGARDDYERLKRLAAWTSRQWKHSPTQMASKSDPVTILREARQGGRFICMNYAVVLAGALRAYGMRARLLNLLPRDVETGSEAHTAVEAWVPQFKKWVLADAQYGIVAESDGVPLSGLELQTALASGRDVRCVVNSQACDEWQPFILRNAFYFKIRDNQRSFGGTATRQLVLVPKGAKEPHKFAGGNEDMYKGAVYTSNPESFYAAPDQH